MDKKRWEQEYPQMPEEFHRAVLKTVEKHTGEAKKQERNRKPRAKKLWLILAAAVLAIGSMAVTAEQKFDFRKSLNLAGSWVAEGIFQTPVPEQESSLLKLKEVMFDGMRLVIYAAPTREGRNYSMETVRMVVGGTEIKPVQTWNDNGKKDVYVFTADLSGIALKAPFEVRQELRISTKGRNAKRFENQELVYTVEGNVTAEALPDQRFVFADYTVNVTDIRKSPIAVQGAVAIEMTEEQKARYEAEGTKQVDGFLTVQGLNGEAWQSLPIAESLQQNMNTDLGDFQGYFYSQLPSEENACVLRLTEQKEKKDDWRGIAQQQFEEESYIGEGMELSLETGGV